jgi:hypothetical protein
MNTNLSATELRRWAEQCDRQSKDVLITGEQHERLVKMRDGLRAVAEAQEWLEGSKHAAA